MSAGVAPRDRSQLERLCRYVSRPPVEEPAVITRILAHPERTWPARCSAAPSGELPVRARAPPWAL